ncbi:MAG TPA: hypothetical protein VJZ71_11165, partial [Phycisphaerae bacterium]|nr:hypothetical protein [Phycisphaerae bacterium]
MATPESDSIADRLARASEAAARKFGVEPANPARIDDALGGAISPQKLVDNLAEVWRTSPEEARSVLEQHGFGSLLARLQSGESAARREEVQGPPLCMTPILRLARDAISIRAWNPMFNDPVTASGELQDSVKTILEAFLPTAQKDVLGVLYRERPAAYADRFLTTDAPKIDEYVRKHFGKTPPKYLVNSGIGANEQFNYFVAALANQRPNRHTTWLLANSPKEVATLLADATIENTLFMEFSRSGITEETVKLHELTPRSARRVVFANAGPLKELGERDGNLVLELPSEVSGRYGRNKTPILLAPMYVAGLDVRSYWATIQAACDGMPLSDRASPPVILAQYLRLQQLRRGVNHIYLGTNDARLRFSGDEFCQFWNEGVNRDGNDITMSRYLGLPRDSHMNLEAILGTSERKMAIFLLRARGDESHPLLLQAADPVRPEHRGLTANDVDLILALANVQRCSEKMPTLLIAVSDVNLDASAWLGQLWADTTLVYSRLI